MTSKCHCWKRLGIEEKSTKETNEDELTQDKADFISHYMDEDVKDDDGDKKDEEIFKKEENLGYREDEALGLAQYQGNVRFPKKSGFP